MGVPSLVDSSATFPTLDLRSVAWSLAVASFPSRSVACFSAIASLAWNSVAGVSAVASFAWSSVAFFSDVASFVSRAVSLAQKSMIDTHSVYIHSVCVNICILCRYYFIVCR